MESPKPADDRGRILRFERPGSAAGRAPRHPAGIPYSASRPPVEDLQKFERSAEDADDYRHRQIVNAAAFVVLALLVAGGIWLAVKMAELQRNQDCVLAGRRNCAQISIQGNAGP